MGKPLYLGTKHEDICVQHECLPNDPSRRTFNNQVDRMTYSANASQPLSQPLSIVIAQWLMDEMAPGAGMQVINGPSNMDIHLPRLIWLRLLLSAQSTSTRPSESPQYGTISWE